jgi:small subunit ribosomal protein S13
MARIAGIEVPQNKKLEIALTSIYGIGRYQAGKIADTANIDKNKRMHDLTSNEINKLNSIIESDFEVEGELRQMIFRNIKRLKDIRAYRGIRHKIGMPVRGQNTRTNAVTRKGRNIAVGGLKRKLEKT